MLCDAQKILNMVLVTKSSSRLKLKITHSVANHSLKSNYLKKKTDHVKRFVENKYNEIGFLNNMPLRARYFCPKRDTVGQYYCKYAWCKNWQ